MKSNVDRKNTDGEILLSIGMIVKNEEKVLGRCLEALQPLMKAISCELIIADTGSTDSTVEIAKKYTDNVFHFEWINDFAAARNSTLEKARGKWFFFLDADEYLDDDIGEMVHFFSIPELYNKYRTLEIMVRSYTDPEKVNYQDGCLARFQRIDDPDDPVRFVGAVHEGIWIRYPLGYFSTILHHTGYCFSSTKQNVSKKERNLAIMREEYKRNPEDLRMLCHLVDGTVFLNDEKEKYINEGLILLKKQRRHLYGNVFYMLAVMHYKDKNPDYALELCEEYYRDAPWTEKAVATVAIKLYKAKILSALGKYSESACEFNDYVDLYSRYKKDELDITDVSAHPIPGIADKEYIQNVYFYALCLNKLKRYDEGHKLLEQFDVEELKAEEFREYLGTVRELCTDEKNYSKLAYYYNLVNDKGDKSKKELVLFMLESSYYSLVTEKERLAFAEDFIKGGAAGLYAELMKLVINQEADDFEENITDLISRIDNWNDGYSELIYLAVKHNIDISSAVINMDNSKVRNQLEKIADSNDDFAGYVLAYGIPESFTESVKQFAWITSLYEKASYRSFNLIDSDKLEMYRRFTMLLGDYVNNIYNPELLNDTDIEVIPRLHQFGYFMSKAHKAYESGDKIMYIREMKHALQHCESMREIVSFMLEQFKKSL